MSKKNDKSSHDIVWAAGCVVWRRIQSAPAAQQPHTDQGTAGKPAAATSAASAAAQVAQPQGAAQAATAQPQAAAQNTTAKPALTARQLAQYGPRPQPDISQFNKHQRVVYAMNDFALDAQDMKALAVSAAQTSDNQKRLRAENYQPDFDVMTDVNGVGMRSHSGLANNPHIPIYSDIQLPRDVEICLIHRRKYDDWGLPKGKSDKNESLAHTAVRETMEETGIPVRLGPLVGCVGYPIDEVKKHGKASRKLAFAQTTSSEPLEIARTYRKQVAYWMGEPLSPAAHAQRELALGGPITKDEETDELVWMPLAEAMNRLSYPSDQQIVQNFAYLWELGASDAGTVLLLRHGTAQSKKHWHYADSQRPLTPVGAAQACGLAPDIAAFAPSRLLTSPARRARQSLLPYSLETGLTLQECNELTPEATAHDSHAGREFLAKVMREAQKAHECVVVETHKPVIVKMMKLLRRSAVSNTSQSLADDGFVESGAGLALTVRLSSAGKPEVIDSFEIFPTLY